MEACASLSADEGTLEPPVGLSCSDPPPEFDSAEAAVDHRAEALRDTNVSNVEAGQMAIFYCGKVNAYDGVSAEKAHAVTQLAASPFQFLQAEPNNGSSAQWGSLGHFTGSSFKLDVTSTDTTVPHPVQSGKTLDYTPQYRQEGDGSVKLVLMVRQSDKYPCKDTLKRKKTGEGSS